MKNIRTIKQMVTAIKQQRISLNMTQAQLGEKSGLGQSQIAKLENQAVEPGLGKVLKVLAALDLELDLTSKNQTSSPKIKLKWKDD